MDKVETISEFKGIFGTNREIGSVNGSNYKADRENSSSVKGKIMINTHRDKNNKAKINATDKNRKVVKSNNGCPL